MCEHMGTGVQEGVQCSTWEYKTMSVGCSKRGGGVGAKRVHGCKKGHKGARVHRCVIPSHREQVGRKKGKEKLSVCVPRLKMAVLT